jgi:drug/metabolite transporter (DMT)-like permease
MLRCAMFDLPVVWLTVWLAREISPARLSARFLIAPVVTAAEGYAVERGPLQLTTLLAAGLLCAGGVMLLVREEPEELPGLRLR